MGERLGLHSHLKKGDVSEKIKKKLKSSPLNNYMTEGEKFQAFINGP